MSNNPSVMSSSAGVRFEAGGHAPEAAERAVRAFAALIGTVGRDQVTSDRVALADTTVRFNLSGGDGYGFTLYLDRAPVELGADDPEAQISVAMTPRQLEELAHGELALAMEIAHGRVAYHGPVRKFLRVIPILRRVSREWLAGPGHGPGPSVQAGHPAAERS